jgi:limonene-1,2-epoxide hydrolase
MDNPPLSVDKFMSNPNIQVVEGYLHGLKSKDLSKVPFAPDVTFEGPLSAKISGIDAVRKFLTGMFPVIRDIRIKRHIAEGEFVATEFDFDTTFGVIPVFDCFRVSDGRLKQIRPYYDPRPITNATK